MSNYTLAHNFLKAGGCLSCDVLFKSYALLYAVLCVLSVSCITLRVVEGDDDVIEQARKRQQKVSSLKKLFKEQRIFLSREVPRESLVFVIR